MNKLKAKPRSGAFGVAKACMHKGMPVCRYHPVIPPSLPACATSPQTYPWLDLSRLDDPSSLAGLLARHRALVFTHTKSALLDALLRASPMHDGHRRTVNVNRSGLPLPRPGRSNPGMCARCPRA